MSSIFFLLTDKPQPHIPRLLLQKACLVSEVEIAKFVEIVPCGCDCHLQPAANRDPPLASARSTSPTALTAVPLQERTTRLTRAGRVETSAAPPPNTLPEKPSGEAESLSSARGSRRCHCTHFMSTSVNSDAETGGVEPVAAAECAWASCEIGGPRSLTPTFLDALVNGMSFLFTQQNGLSPQAVVDYYLHNIDVPNDPQGITF